MSETYEYAGFVYEVIHDGETVRLTPIPGQHSAANKEKHIRAARECYKQDRVKK